jgi:hypothetical protein
MNFNSIPAEARLEAKYVAPEFEYHRLLHWIRLHSHGFFVHFPDRLINNIYFDSHGYDSFDETLAGISSRTKLRYRWYGDTHFPTEGTLEFKNRKNQYTWKDSYKLTENILAEKTNWKIFFANLAGALPHDTRCRMRESPVPILINRYKRNYFINRDQSVRITLDTGLKVFDQRYNPSPNFTRKAMRPQHVILEVKFSEKKRDYVSEILMSIPVSMSRNSKYAYGVRGLRDH